MEINTVTNTDSLIDTRAAAEILGVSHWTLRAWRTQTSNPLHPPFVRVGPKAVRYSRAALVRWAESRECQPDQSGKSHDPGSHKDCRGRGDR